MSNASHAAGGLDLVLRRPGTPYGDRAEAELIPVTLRNDPVDDETERVARTLCAELELDPDALVDGEPQWRQYVEMAVNAIDSWRALTR